MSVQAIAGGRYEVERELGRGGMASVHLARDRELGRRVAIKVLAAHLTTDSDIYERFVREARLAARLSHPNVVQVYDAGQEDGRPFIVMEYVPGHTLADEVRERGRLDAPRAVALAQQVCAGLERAHAEGLVHRDVKPQNLLLRDDGVLKITDFGIARATEASGLTQIGSVLGTGAYLAPEQAAGEPVTAAADLYGVGVVLYELLTGRTPYAYTSLAELVAVQRARPVTSVRDAEPSVPTALEAVVVRCLARDPAARPASAAALARELARVAESPTQAATAVTTIARPAHPDGRAGDAAPTRVVSRRPPARSRRRRWPWLAAALVAAALVAAAVVALGAGDGDPSGGESPASVEPVPDVADPGGQASALADWIRANGSG